MPGEILALPAASFFEASCVQDEGSSRPILWRLLFREQLTKCKAVGAWLSNPLEPCLLHQICESRPTSACLCMLTTLFDPNEYGGCCFFNSVGQSFEEFSGLCCQQLIDYNSKLFAGIMSIIWRARSELQWQNEWCLWDNCHGLGWWLHYDKQWDFSIRVVLLHITTWSFM